MEMNEEDIIRLITTPLPPEEKEELLSMVSQSDENKETYYKLKNLWALTSQQTLANSVGQEDAQIFKKNIRRKKRTIIQTRTLSFIKYAAIIFLAFFASKLIFQTRKTDTKVALVYNEIMVPPGQMAQLTLSDGTSVMINSCSTLRYPAIFQSGERKVFLTGEAYFSVAKSKIPFLVKTSHREVKVLGTKFNVMDYPTDKLYQTTLIEGRIAMLDTSGKEFIQLTPGDQYSFDHRHNRQVVKKVNTNLYDSWKDGIYVFDHETLGGLSERLERIFAVKIIIQNDRIRNYKFTGTISRNVPFEQILKIIQVSAPVKYTLKEVNGAVKEVKLN
jgi:transmembrane sensor